MNQDIEILKRQQLSYLKEEIVLLKRAISFTGVRDFKSKELNKNKEILDAFDAHKYF